MKYLNPILLIFVLQTISSSVSASETIGYKAGQLASISEECGQYDLSHIIDKKFGHYKDYATGQVSVGALWSKGDTAMDEGNALQVDSDLDCKRANADIERLLSGKHSLSSSKSQYVVSKNENSRRSLSTIESLFKAGVITKNEFQKLKVKIEAKEKRRKLNREVYRNKMSDKEIKLREAKDLWSKDLITNGHYERLVSKILGLK